MDPSDAQSQDGDGFARVPDIPLSNNMSDFAQAGETALASVDLSQATQALSEARLADAEDLVSENFDLAQAVLDNTSNLRGQDQRTGEKRPETRSTPNKSQSASNQGQAPPSQRSRASNKNSGKEQLSSSPSEQDDVSARQQGEGKGKSVDDQIEAGKSRVEAAEKRKQEAEQRFESAQDRVEEGAETGKQHARDAKKKLDQGRDALDGEDLESKAQEKAADCFKNPFKKYKERAQAMVYKVSVGVLSLLLTGTLVFGVGMPMGWVQVPSFDYVLLVVFISMTLLELLRERLAYLTDNNLNYQKLPARQFLCQPRSIVMSFLWIPASFATGDRPTIYRVCAETLVSGAVLVASLANEEFFFGPEGVPSDWNANGEDICPRFSQEEDCETTGCCIWDSGTCWPSPTEKCTGLSVGPTGAEVCEGFNWEQNECLGIGCCQWDSAGAFCTSAVGDGACAISVNGEFACEQVEEWDEQTCDYIGCCQWDVGENKCFSDVGTGTCDGFNRLFNEEFACEEGGAYYMGDDYYSEYYQEYCSARSSGEPSRDPVMMGGVLVGIMGVSLLVAAYLCFRGEIMTKVQPKEGSGKQSKRWTRVSKIFACLQATTEDAVDAAEMAGEDIPGNDGMMDDGDSDDQGSKKKKKKGGGYSGYPGLDDEDDDEEEEEEEEEETKKKKKTAAKKGTKGTEGKKTKKERKGTVS